MPAGLGVSIEHVAERVVSSSKGLIERDGELAAVRELIVDAAAGNARIAVVEGPAGIGKSGLLAALRVEAAAGDFRVLSARGTDLERAFPFGVVRQLFEPLVASGAGERWLVDAASAAAPVFRAPDVDDGAGQQDVSFAALHGLYWLTLNLAADGPLALVVDDLHWADVPSLRFLSYLAHRLEGVPLLVALGIRTAEPGTDAALLAELVADPLSTHVRPGPLTVAAVDELVRERLGEPPAPAFSKACHEATGGNPLLLHELLKTLAGEGVQPVAKQARLVRELGSRAISRTVLMRLARLSQDAVGVARSVAVLGEGADIRAIAEVGEIDPARVATATRELTRAEILRPDVRLEFVHPLVRDAVYGDLAAGERELLHARAVAALRRVDAPIEQIASHWLILPRRGDPEVAAALREAAGMAHGRGAPDGAVAYLSRALEEPLSDGDRAHVLLELGLAAAELQLDEASDWLRAAYEALTDPVERARAAAVLARQLCVAGRAPEAAEAVRTALAELPDDADDERRRLEAMELFAVAFGAPAPAFGDRLEELRAGIGEGAWVLESQVTLYEALLCRPAVECVPRARAAIEEGSILLTDPPGALACIIVLVLAELRDGLELLEGLRGVAHRSGSLFSVVGLQVWRSWSLLTFGEIDEAAESLQDAAETHAAWAGTRMVATDHTAAFLVRTLLEQSDLAGAQRALAGCAPATPGSDAWHFARLAEAELLLADGRDAEVVALLERMEPSVRRADNPAWLPWRPVAARALARLGRAEEALSVAEQDLERARRWGAPGPIGRALRVRAELAGGDEEQLREAVDVLAQSAWRLERANALASLGRAVRLRRRPTDAREPLAQALEIAESCGATALARDVRTELYATGARPRTSSTTGAGSLTPSELRVAKLATEGKTNREIAQALYVTPKTVEVHLSSAYRKLGIKSRSRLAPALAGSAAGS